MGIYSPRHHIKGMAARTTRMFPCLYPQSGPLCCPWWAWAVWVGDYELAVGRAGEDQFQSTLHSSGRGFELCWKSREAIGALSSGELIDHLLLESVLETGCEADGNWQEKSQRCGWGRRREIIRTRAREWQQEWGGGSCVFGGSKRGSNDASCLKQDEGLRGMNATVTLVA